MEKRKINRVRRNKVHRPFESKDPRERNACPECESINVRKRVGTRDYKCYHCGWIGENRKKIMW